MKSVQELKKPVSEFLNSPNLVKICVGPDRKEFHMHEEPLCDRIDYFKAAFKGGFKEGQDKEIQLPEDDPVPFAEVVNWVYGQKIECKGLSCRTVDGSAEDCRVIDLFVVYVLADKYEIEGLMEMCIEACKACYKELAMKGWTPDYKEVAYMSKLPRILQIESLGR